MFTFFLMQIKTIRLHDPAVRSVLEVLFCYPGLHALMLHYPANWLWRLGFCLLARVISNLNRFITGIEIHPGAQVHPSCFIDHGMGIVIGETAEIGENVRIYHGVTLGGTGKDKGKRHPTVAANVLIGAGATVLGPIHVGENSRIGAGAVVMHDVAPGTTMVGVPAVPVQRGRRIHRCELSELRSRVENLEKLLEAKHEN
ncbi:MAG: serine O-acetyltransferase [Firmicutes bacterium]|nr:serine O-acetyltransferase [Bacillota bacterium]